MKISKNEFKEVADTVGIESPAFEISFNPFFASELYMHPYIQLEIFESQNILEPQQNQIQSLTNKILNSNYFEIENALCSPYELIIAEKFISLLRRTSEELREIDKNPDHALVRHVYDINLIYKKKALTDSLFSIIPKVLSHDIKKYGARNEYFKMDPIKEMEFVLNELISDKKFAKRYNLFLDPLVYGNKYDNWQDSLLVISDIFNKFKDHISK